jgi:hypothetical protein
MYSGTIVSSQKSEIKRPMKDALMFYKIRYACIHGCKTPVVDNANIVRNNSVVDIRRAFMTNCQP